jgi:hypothetical protein
MSPELINILQNKHKFIQLNLEKTNVFSLGMILI